MRAFDVNVSNCIKAFHALLHTYMHYSIWAQRAKEKKCCGNYDGYMNNTWELYLGFDVRVYFSPALIRYPVFFEYGLPGEMVSEVSLDGVPWSPLVSSLAKKSILDKRFPTVGVKKTWIWRSKGISRRIPGRFHDCVKMSSKVQIGTKETFQIDRF